VTEPISKSTNEIKNFENVSIESFVKIQKGKRFSGPIFGEKERMQYFQKISNSKEKQRKITQSHIENTVVNNLSRVDVKASSISTVSKIFQIPLISTLRHNKSQILISDTTSNLLKTGKIERKMTYDFESFSNKDEFERTFYENVSKFRHSSHDEGFPLEMEMNMDKEDQRNDLSAMDNSICSGILNSTVQYDFELKLFKRGEDLRRSYINKLITTKIWQPSKKEKKHNTMIIFDWDDTLLCTSYLTPTGIFNEEFELSEKDKEKLAKLEDYVVRIINLAVAKGDTYIITNAAPGWVEYSAERFYPQVKEILHKVTIVSARGEYEKLYPGDSRQWKIQAFLEMKKNFDSDLVANIICMGDSIIEMEAAHVLASKFSQAFIKTIKFREAPKPEELVKQLSLVAEQFSTIYSSVKNLTIRVERKGNKK
jgi:hypothetical protein